MTLSSTANRTYTRCYNRHDPVTLTSQHIYAYAPFTMSQGGMDVHHYILDPSALIYGGIGKIKQWVETSNNQNRDDSNAYSIVFYVPLYTIRELDFLKKVFNPLISANAKESIKFIDNQMSSVQFENDVSSFVDFEDDTDNEELGGTGVESADDDSLLLSNDEDEGAASSINSATFGFKPNAQATNAAAAIEKYKQEQREMNKPADFNDYTDFESYNKMKSLSNSKNKNKKNREQHLPNFVTFIVENENSSGPDWKIASGYRRSTPLISQLPAPINGSSSQGQFNHDNRKKVVGVFGNNIPGTFNMIKMKNNDSLAYGYGGDRNNHGFGNKHGIHDQSTRYVGDSNDETSPDEKAVVPIRLKYFIRSCIQKHYIENKNLREDQKIKWDIICEDATTAIWLKSFGLDVKTLNEVQKEFDGFSGGSKANVLFDPTSGGFVEANALSPGKEKKSNKHKTMNKPQNKGTDDSNVFDPKRKNNRYKKNKNKIKNKNKNPVEVNTSESHADTKENDNAANLDAKPTKRVITADSFATRRPGELWTS
jgi:hypothetical protein